MRTSMECAQHVSQYKHHDQRNQQDQSLHHAPICLYALRLFMEPQGKTSLQPLTSLRQIWSGIEWFRTERFPRGANPYGKSLHWK